ncbi:MAG: formyltransferase [Pseudomonadota bacterium]|nr:formyltransferase [Pseudomonadota bacterium]
MRAVVFAYSNMGVTGLEALERHGFDIRTVFTHQDDPVEKRWFASVAAWAEGRGIPVWRPEEVNAPEWTARIVALAPEVIFSFYYRKILRREILAAAPAGAFNLHGSLLPAYRGRVPVNWVLVNGEERTGVTLHWMTARADAGDIVGQRSVAIDFSDTALTLYEKLCREAALLLDEALPLIRSGRTPRIPQDDARATYFGGRKPADGRIDWRRPARQIYDLIRAVTDPYPGAFTFLPDGTKMLVWWGLPEPATTPPPGGGPQAPEGTPGPPEGTGADPPGAGGDGERGLFIPSVGDAGCKKRGEAGEADGPPGRVLLDDRREASVAAGVGRLRLLHVEIDGMGMRGGQIGRYFRDLGGAIVLR